MMRLSGRDERMMMLDMYTLNERCFLLHSEETTTVIRSRNLPLSGARVSLIDHQANMLSLMLPKIRTIAKNVYCSQSCLSAMNSYQMTPYEVQQASLKVNTGQYSTRVV